MKGKGNRGKYANLVLVCKEVHILIHASLEATIKQYLQSLHLDEIQLKKLNKLRVKASMPPIIL